MREIKVYSISLIISLIISLGFCSLKKKPPTASPVSKKPEDFPVAENAKPNGCKALTLETPFTSG